MLGGRQSTGTGPFITREVSPLTAILNPSLKGTADWNPQKHTPQQQNVFVYSMLFLHTCLVKNEDLQRLQCSVCVIKSSHRFSSLEQQDVRNSYSAKPGRKATIESQKTWMNHGPSHTMTTWERTAVNETGLFCVEGSDTRTLDLPFLTSFLTGHGWGCKSLTSRTKTLTPGQSTLCQFTWQKAFQTLQNAHLHPS